MVESSSSPSANKRSRDPATEDEAYLDNFHSHKRYLSEIMASSLNGLTVGESMPQNLLESPARSETMSYLSQHNPAEESLAASESDSTKPPCRRDDVSLQYSPMSEDSDDAQYSETPINASIAPSDSLSTGQSSPHRHQRLLNGAMVTSYPSISCNLTAVACSQPRQRGSDSEGRFPSSPSDICHSPDLRRAALLRSVQMRVQPPAPPSYDLPSSPEQESMHNMEAEDHPCSCGKSLVDECVCQDQQQSSSLFAEECSSIKVPESELSREKSRKLLDMNVKEESCEEAFGSSFGRHDLMTSRRSILGEDLKSRLDSNK